MLKVDISVRQTSAIVTYDSSKVAVQDMVKALDKAGFPVKGQPKILQ